MTTQPTQDAIVTQRDHPQPERPNIMSEIETLATWTYHEDGLTRWHEWNGFKVRQSGPTGPFWYLSDYKRPEGQRIIKQYETAGQAKFAAEHMEPHP